MKRKTGVKIFLYTVMISGLLIFVSTWLPSIYEPIPKETGKILQNIQEEYRKIAMELKLEENSFQDVVMKQDIEDKTSSLDIQNRAKEAMN